MQNQQSVNYFWSVMKDVLLWKQLFFLDIIGRGETFSEHGFQASFIVFTTDTRHLDNLS